MGGLGVLRHSLYPKSTARNEIQVFITMPTPKTTSIYRKTWLITLGLGLLLNCGFANASDTEVTLSGGVLTITDANGANSNDDITISYSGGTYTIADGGGLTINTDVVNLFYTTQLSGFLRFH